ncbi:unnamed protein product [Spodoptera exigua]|nr:unnamed protein product [Spodoptera exigua]
MGPNRANVQSGLQGKRKYVPRSQLGSGERTDILDIRSNIKSQTLIERQPYWAPTVVVYWLFEARAELYSPYARVWFCTGGVSQGLISRIVKETHAAEEAATKIQTPAKERNVKINYTAQSVILRKLLYNMG